MRSIWANKLTRAFLLLNFADIALIVLAIACNTGLIPGLMLPSAVGYLSEFLGWLLIGFWMFLLGQFGFMEYFRQDSHHSRSIRRARALYPYAILFWVLDAVCYCGLLIFAGAEREYVPVNVWAILLNISIYAVNILQLKYWDKVDTERMSSRNRP